jgi:hypothetical protein
MGGPRAPHERDAAVLRLEGRHPGMATLRRTPTPSVLNREKLKEGGKGEVSAVVLTLRRRCSRSRVENGRWRGEVGVPGDVGVPAPARLPSPTRTASSLSHERRLKATSLACRRRPGEVDVPAPVRLPAPPLPGATQRRCASSFLQAGTSRGSGEWENPKGVGGLASVPRLPGALLKGGRKQPGVDFPNAPGRSPGRGRWIPWRPLVLASDARGAEH